MYAMSWLKGAMQMRHLAFMMCRQLLKTLFLQRNGLSSTNWISARGKGGRCDSLTASVVQSHGTDGTGGGGGIDRQLLLTSGGHGGSSCSIMRETRGCIYSQIQWSRRGLRGKWMRIAAAAAARLSLKCESRVFSLRIEINDSLTILHTVCCQ